MSDLTWTKERIKTHIAAELPLAALLGIEIVEATAKGSLVRLVGAPSITRPGGMIAGPVLFAMADIATYALTLAIRQEDAAATTTLQINFFRPVRTLPLLAEAVPLKAGRQLSTYDVRFWPEAGPPDKLAAQATATWAFTQGNAA